MLPNDKLDITIIPEHVKRLALGSALFGIDLNPHAQNLASAAFDEADAIAEVFGLSIREFIEAMCWIGRYHREHRVYSDLTGLPPPPAAAPVPDITPQHV